MRDLGRCRPPVNPQKFGAFSSARPLGRLKRVAQIRRPLLSVVLEIQFWNDVWGGGGQQDGV